MKTFYITGVRDNIIIDGDGEEYYKTKNGYAVIQFRSLSTGEMNFHAIKDKSWSFAICSQNRDGRALPKDWIVIRSFGSKCPNSETIKLIVPDDTTFFLKEVDIIL